jgi:hypothetical protein
MAKKCECEEVMCIQSWPEGCYCANAAKEQCHKKCGGKKPKFQVSGSLIKGQGWQLIRLIWNRNVHRKAA